MKKLLSKISAPLAAALVAALGFGSIASAAVLGPINLNGSATSGGNLSISGLCGTGANGQPITFSVVGSNGVTTSLNGSTTGAGANGQFNTTVTIPNSVSTGSGTLIANCGNGDTLQIPLNIAGSASTGTVTNGNTNLDIVTGNPLLGGTVTVNGVCPNSTQGNATFSIVQNGSTMNVASNFAPISANGTFSATLNVPSGVVAGNATLVANCGNGTTVSAPLTFSASPVPFLNVSGNGTLGGTLNVNGTCANGANGNVTFSLLQNGNTINLGTNPTTTSIGANGNFSTTINLPSTLSLGNGTLLATCNGITTPLSTNINLTGNTGNTGNNNTGGIQMPGVVNLGLFVNGDPSLSNGANVTGTCPTNTGVVNFSVLQNGVTTNLTGTAPISSTGTFAANLTLPSTLTVGPATIVANCNVAGNTNSTVTLTAPAAVVLGASATPIMTPSRTPAVLGASATPSVLGASTGMGGTATSSDSALAITVLLGALAVGGAMYAARKAQLKA